MLTLDFIRENRDLWVAKSRAGKPVSLCGHGLQEVLEDEFGINLEIVKTLRITLAKTSLNESIPIKVPRLKKACDDPFVYIGIDKIMHELFQNAYDTVPDEWLGKTIRLGIDYDERPQRKRREIE